MAIKTTVRLQCEECEAFCDEGDAIKLYECGNCGNIFYADTHKCGDCGKFAALYSNSACPECKRGDTKTVDVVICPFCDDDEILEDDYGQHLRNNHVDEVVIHFLDCDV